MSAEQRSATWCSAMQISTVLHITAPDSATPLLQRVSVYGNVLYTMGRAKKERPLCFTARNFINVDQINAK